MIEESPRIGTCICCAERDPAPDLGPACGVCRSRLASQLREIPLLCDLLAAGPRPQVSAGEQRTVELVEHEVGDDGSIATRTEVRRERPVDIAAAAVPGLSSAPRVGGSRERAVPIRVDALDLLGEVDERTVHDHHLVALVAGRDLVRSEKTFRCRCGRPELHANQPARPVLVPSGDQTGYVSVATVLHGWCRDWSAMRRESEPRPSVPGLCRYLLDRLDWAFTGHAAVDEFAAEVGDLWHALRRTAGLTIPKPELCEGVPCRSIECDLKTLYRVPGSDYIECASCGLLLTVEEYASWCRLLVASARKTVVPRS